MEIDRKTILKNTHPPENKMKTLLFYGYSGKGGDERDHTHIL
jgi:hypothetical protein